MFTHKFLSQTHILPDAMPLPTVLTLHGTGGSENDLLPLARRLFPGAAVLALRGNISEFGASRFFKRFAEGVFDMESLREETEKLAEFVSLCAQKYGFDIRNVWALGYSNGANIAASLLLSHPETLRGAVLLRAMTPFEPSTLPDLTGKKIFLAAGKDDPLVPPANVSQLRQIFQSAGAEVKLHFANEGHGLSGYELDAILQWLENSGT